MNDSTLHQRRFFHSLRPALWCCLIAALAFGSVQACAGVSNPPVVTTDGDGAGDAGDADTKNSGRSPDDQSAVDSDNRADSFNAADTPGAGTDASDSFDGRGSIPPITSSQVFWPKPEGIAAPAAFPKGLEQRSCPLDDNGKPLFKGKPCSAESRNECISQGCQPKDLRTQATKAPGSFFDDCSDKLVHCVGATREFKTLREAFAAVDTKAPQNNIKIDSGRFLEASFLSGYDGKLVIEGVSDDRRTGSLLVAPANAKSDDNYAALRFVNVKEIVVQRLVISGAGHGILAEGFAAVQIDHNHLVANAKTGISLRKAKEGKASINNNVIQFNGAVGGTYGNGLVSVQIDHNHRGQNPYAVQIDHNHRGQNPYAVQIDHNHRVFGRLRYGLASEGVREVSVGQNVIRNNGAGGVLISSSPIAVQIDHNHRVGFGGGEIAVQIDHNHRVVMDGNRIAHNGPIGFSGYASQRSDKSGCPPGLAREGGSCFPSLISKGGKGFYALGVGVMIAGAGNVQIRSNSIYGNDAFGMLLHSSKSANLVGNEISRNGLRPKLSSFGSMTKHYAGAAIWGIEESLQIERNLVLDQLVDGIVVAHAGSATLQLKMYRNHFAGQGTALPTSQRNLGSGMRFSSTGGGIKLGDVSQNFFGLNRRAGLFSNGSIFGTISDNYFFRHARRALAITDLSKEVSRENALSIKGNVVDGATGYGVQLYAGSAAVRIEKNIITAVAQLDGRTGDPLVEGDALNVSNIQGVQVKITENRFAHSKRAGCFIARSSVEISGNTYDACANKLLQKTQGSEPMAKNARAADTEMHNRKNFDEP